jgi:hypothetical protein
MAGGSRNVSATEWRKKVDIFLLPLPGLGHFDILFPQLTPWANF